MAKLFISIFNMSISASYLILAVLLVRFVLRKAPKSMRCFLWLLVGIRLLFPFSVESVFSLIPDTQVADEYTYEMILPAMDTETKVQDTKVPVSQPAENPYISPDGLKPDNTLIAILAGARLWILGMLLMLSYMAVSWFRLQGRVRAAIPTEFTPDDGHTIKYYQSDAIEAPFLFGLFKPRIYIPCHIASEELPYVLLHERTHQKRKDYLIKPFGFLLLSVYWFNPCVWIAYIMLCKDIELICDEKVVQELGTQCKRAYSQALLSCAVNRRMISACPVAFGEVSVKARVKNVLNYKKPAFWILAAAILACIIVPVCFMTQKKSASPEHEESAIAENIAGDYFMAVSQQDESWSVPHLALGRDGRFSFTYSLFSSYLPYGNYELENNILTAVTDDGKYHYQFTLAKNGNLTFDAEQSSDIKIIEAGVDAPIENGSIFVKDSTFSTKAALAEGESLLEETRQEMYQGMTPTVSELEEKVIAIAELQKQLAVEEAVLNNQLKELEMLQLNQDEIAIREAELQELTQKAQNISKQLEEARAEIQSMQESVEANQTAYEAIEQWAQAFCDRDGATIVKLADEKVEQKLVDDDLLIHGFDGEKDYVSFGWSSPWPWGDDYDENVTAHNYRIVSVTERSAEILYYAWVSDPHVTVWRELLTYKLENDKCIITSETLQYRDCICTAEEFEQAYPARLITGTMMDYYSFNGAGEALNNNAKADKKMYAKLFEPDTAAVYLLNLLNNPNKVGTRTHVGKSDTYEDTCTVAIEFYEDGNSVEISMIRPYGSDGIWLPYTQNTDDTKALGVSDASATKGTDASSSSYVITSQNIDSVIEEDTRTLEALFPNHHEFSPVDGFSKSVDLNGDGIEETIELTNLGYNGGDGGYALKVTDSRTGKKIPLPDGYTEEEGFPIKTFYENPEGEEQSRLRIQLGDIKHSVTIATIMSDSLIRIYERKWQFDEMKSGYLKKGSFDSQTDTISGCNIITYNNEKNPTLVLKSYVSGCLGHIDSLGYVITELRLHEDNTWDSKHYFLLDSCGDKQLIPQEYESAASGGPSTLPFENSTDIHILPLTPSYPF